jgi:hypothetical protein
MADLKYCPTFSWKDRKTMKYLSEVAGNLVHIWTKYTYLLGVCVISFIFFKIFLTPLLLLSTKATVSHCLRACASSFHRQSY